jgi:glycerol-3-phosphate cytidylyltransferase
MTVLGYVPGVFDMFHIGHLNILRRASEHCDRLMVALTTDDYALSRKGKLPVVPYAERLQIVSEIRYVDEVVPQTNPDKIEAWEHHRYNAIFVGDDWRGTPIWDRFEPQFALRGVQVFYFPYTRHTSSTALRAKVFSG